MKVSTDSSIIEEILSRSVSALYPNKEALKKALESGEQLTIYNGIDPTADYVHLGHSTNYLLLDRLHKLGHKIIVLVGDFTAMIGDPTDKEAARVQLTSEDIQKNLASFKEQIGKILDFEDTENPIEFTFNSEWLKKLNFEDLIKLASNFTVQQMLERDMFEKRIKEQSPLYVHEFFYPLMQGYDSVALDVDMEIGGTDQTFNMLAGRTLLKRYKDKEKMVITTTLLENPATGKKMMSKSEGTGISLNDSPDDMFTKTMKLPDEGIAQVFIDCTQLSLDEIESKKKEAKDDRDLKLMLAQEIVSMYYSEKEATEAQEKWIAIFSEGEIPKDIPVCEVSENTSLVEALTLSEHASSKSEARRLIEQGGVVDTATEEKITDPKYSIESTVTLRIKKHSFITYQSV